METIPTTKREWVSQRSPGIGGNVHPTVTYFIPEGASFRCQVNDVAHGEQCLGLDIAYLSGLSLHGSLADLRRLSELIRTTLDEWEQK